MGLENAPVECYNWSMTVLFRCRVEKPLLEKANAVTQSLGTSTSEMVRVFLTQIAKTGKVPVSLDAAEPLVGKKRRNDILKGLDETETW